MTFKYLGILVNCKIERQNYRSFVCEAKGIKVSGLICNTFGMGTLF